MIPRVSVSHYPIIVLMAFLRNDPLLLEVLGLGEGLLLLEVDPVRRSTTWLGDELTIARGGGGWVWFCLMVFSRLLIASRSWLISEMFLRGSSSEDRRSLMMSRVELISRRVGRGSFSIVLCSSSFIESKVPLISRMVERLPSWWSMLWSREEIQYRENQNSGSRYRGLGLDND